MQTILILGSLNTPGPLAEQVAAIFDSLTILQYLIIFGAVIIGAVVSLIISEKLRMNSYKAKAQLKRLQSSNDGNAGLRQAVDEIYQKAGMTDHDEHMSLERKLIKQSKWSIPAGLISIVMFAVIIIAFLCGIGLMTTYTTALKHGHYKGINVTTDKMWYRIENSPVESKLPDDFYDDPTGCLIIYYKFGCPDCEAMHQQLTDLTADMKNIYWISTRSEQGQTLLEKYPVSEVPSAVYIKHDGTPLTYILYRRIDNTTVPDEQAISDMLDAISKDH